MYIDIPLQTSKKINLNIKENFTLCVSILEAKEKHK
jgi:hypothetical protein